MRIIDENNCPPNIRTFRAKDEADAFRKADALFRDPKVQGVVWLREDFNKVSVNNTANIISEHKIRTLSDQLNFFQRVATFFTEEAFAAYIAQIGLKNVSIREDFFVKTHESIQRYPHKLTSKIHIDGRKVFARKDVSLAFCGLPFRTITTVNGPGTHIYDPSELNADTRRDILEGKFKNTFLTNAKPWQVKTGDTLFLKWAAWDEGQALMHASPKHFSFRWKAARHTITRTFAHGFV